MNITLSRDFFARKVCFCYYFVGTPLRGVHAGITFFRTHEDGCPFGFCFAYCRREKTDSHVGLSDLLGMTGISGKFVGTEYGVGKKEIPLPNRGRGILLLNIYLRRNVLTSKGLISKLNFPFSTGMASSPMGRSSISVSVADAKGSAVVTSTVPRHWLVS